MVFHPAIDETSERARRWVLRTSLALVALFLSAGAQAMAPEIGIDCEHCQYPTAVRMPLCSGVYMGNGLVITAAHCVDNVSEGVSKARFGEQEGQWEYEIVINECEAHPAGSPDTNSYGYDSWSGPDIAYCVLDEHLEDLGAVQGATPIIPPFLPEGCERDWLAHEVYETSDHATATAVGAGCGWHAGAAEDCGDGTKRFSAQQVVRQTAHAGSSTKLELQRDLWGGGDSGIWSGDSGGPLFIRMPDQTYRLLGVMHGRGYEKAYAEAVPPYLHWIEQASGIDITPYHYYSGSSYVATGATAMIPKAEFDAFWGDWYYTCSAAPKGISESYTDSPLISGSIDCPGWLTGPGDKAIEQDDDGSHLESQVESFQALEGEDEGWGFVAHDSLVVDQGDFAAPKAFLPVEVETTREFLRDDDDRETFELETYEIPTTR